MYRCYCSSSFYLLSAAKPHCWYTPQYSFACYRFRLQVLPPPSELASSSPLMDIGNAAPVVCFVCKIQNASYRCPRCSSRYCSAACYQRHGANCTETFYREHVTDMLKSSHSDSDSKRKMVEILRRCNLAEDDGGEVTGAKNAEFLGSVLESVDLRDAEYEELAPEQQAAFRQAVSQGRLDHLIDVWSPWWISAPLTGLCSQPSPAHSHPIPVMSSLCNVPPSPSVGFVIVACSCCYAVLMRVWNGEPDAHMAHALLRSCKFLSKQEASSVQMHSADSVLNDCFTCLCDAAVGLPRAAIPAAVADLLCILASRHFVLSALSVAPPPPYITTCLFVTFVLIFLLSPHSIFAGCQSLAAAEFEGQGCSIRPAQSCIFAVFRVYPHG